MTDTDRDRARLLGHVLLAMVIAILPAVGYVVVRVWSLDSTAAVLQNQVERLEEDVRELRKQKK